MKLQIAPRAEADLDEIWLHIAHDRSVVSAERVINEIIATFKMLVKSPNIGSLQMNAGPNVHSFRVLSYRIYYRKTKNILRVLHVRHAKRDERRLPKL